MPRDARTLLMVLCQARGADWAQVNPSFYFAQTLFTQQEFCKLIDELADRFVNNSQTRHRPVSLAAVAGKHRAMPRQTIRNTTREAPALARRPPAATRLSGPCHRTC
ncbi:hypothetical protein [Paracoccus sp. (in: a-proteobacteria)]|uniref:hypothetical protein n=1 Tax=Paracoccus sp. TaxID=267 RepID=UPI0032206304